MKLKRFVAKDMKEALTLVKDELGADAIIMSNKRVAAGVEIVAGVESLPSPMPNAPVSAQGKAQTYAKAPMPYMGRPVGNQIAPRPDSRINVTVGGSNSGATAANPNSTVDSRLIGGKNQAYAQSLIEILERQNTMSQEQGDQLMDNISRKINERNASRANAQTNNMAGMRMPPALPEAQAQDNRAPLSDGGYTRPRMPQMAANPALINPSLKVSDSSADFTPSPLTDGGYQAQGTQTPIISPNADMSEHVSTAVNADSNLIYTETRYGSDSLEGTGVSRIINPNPPTQPTQPPLSEADAMAIDAKKAGPSTIDPSLDEDAELFKTPPLPLAQQREFKNFFGKSKVKQEKDEYESKAGINTYRAGGSDDSVRKDLEQMRSEVENIRKLLQFELAGLLQDNRSRSEPVRAMIFKLLHSVGFSDNVADLLVDQVPQGATFNNAWRELVGILEQAILVGEDEIVSRGGIVTLIGPAGVGKTTTLAKLAARFVMRFGPQRVAIVTADHYRIGAVEQIKTYGRIMGCSTFAVKNLSELPQLLYNLSDKSLILVDTAGVGFKDERFNTQLKQLKLQSSLKLKHYLVLPCTTQRKVLQHAYDHFSVVGLAGLILTKVDECQNLGDSLSLSIEMKLPISYVTDGQRVPEDLDVPHPNMLARRALAAVEDDAAQGALDDF